jgi:hypothetical protein
MQVHTDISMHNAHMKGPREFFRGTHNTHGLKSLPDVLIEELEYVVLPLRDRKVEEIVPVL